MVIFFIGGAWIKHIIIFSLVSILLHLIPDFPLLESGFPSLENAYLTRGNVVGFYP